MTQHPNVTRIPAHSNGLGRLTVGIVLVSTVAMAASTSLPAQHAPSAAARADAFSNVHCSADVPKSLIGKTLPNKPSAVLEAAHKDIRLKDLGGSDLDDNLFLGSWQMCDHEYQLLVRHDRIEDALEFPAHSRRQPAFLGACILQGSRVDHVVAVLDNPAPRTANQPRYAPDDTTSLASIAAWRVDAGTRRLTKMVTSGLRCPRGGIVTVDGGT